MAPDLSGVHSSSQTPTEPWSEEKVPTPCKKKAKTIAASANKNTSKSTVRLLCVTNKKGVSTACLASASPGVEERVWRGRGGERNPVRCPGALEEGRSSGEMCLKLLRLHDPLSAQLSSTSSSSVRKDSVEGAERIRLELRE
uniref:Uncharacterized protein n=1 Tax=Knipowitschia caucasica TaxID=637954 RepID=A0AAV2J997_KNICA